MLENRIAIRKHERMYLVDIVKEHGAKLPTIERWWALFNEGVNTMHNRELRNFVGSLSIRNDIATRDGERRSRPLTL